MDPVFVVFWATIALEVGFLVGYAAVAQTWARWRKRTLKQLQQMLIPGSLRNLRVARDEYAREVIFGLAVLAGILDVGWLCGVLLGNPWLARTAITFAFAAGLTWGAWGIRWQKTDPWYPDFLSHCGNHEWHSGSPFGRLSWWRRFFFWDWSRMFWWLGFPSSQQMKIQRLFGLLFEGKNPKHRPALTAEEKCAVYDMAAQALGGNPSRKFWRRLFRLEGVNSSLRFDLRYPGDYLIIEARALEYALYHSDIDRLYWNGDILHGVNYPQHLSVNPPPFHPWGPGGCIEDGRHR